MAVEIKVPDMGESVIEATVARWMKQEGEPVAAGEALVELETDKVNLEVSAQQAGVLEKILKPAGETVGVGEILATVGGGGTKSAEGATGSGGTKSAEGGNGTPQAPAGAQQASAPTAPADGPVIKEQPAPAETDASPALTVDHHRVTEEGARTAGAAADAPASQRATPLAARMAQDLGVNLAQVTATGPGGRITKEDVQRAGQSAPAAPAAAAEPAAEPVVRTPETPAAAPTAAAQPAVRTPAAAPTPAPAPQTASSAANGRLETRQRMSRRRQTIARRLVEAQHTAAMLTTFNEIDMSAVMELRKRRREAFKERYSVDLGFMSFFVKATIAALKAFPNLNAEIASSAQGDEIVQKHYYDIGVAIGAEEGLVVPVIRDADRLNFAGVEQAIRDYAAQVKQGTLTLESLRGGTFTITNGGVFGSLLSTPILNPPQVGILGMHGIKERPVAVNGEIVIRPMMYVALTYDHRIVDGREAVQFLVRVKELIEDPETLLFG
jgi:2-oxoglutarate dehydrogenase E2 component (dihydrolipoamide succinyltransferase)